MSFVAGDCLKPETIENKIQDVDAVIHTLGVLFDSKEPGRSYREMNRDAAVNVARIMQAAAKDQNCVKPFVKLSSARAPIFCPQYLSYKFEAEDFIINECTNLKPVMLRPGFVYDLKHRPWSIPLKFYVDLFAKLEDLAVRDNERLRKMLADLGVPAKSVPLSSVAHFAIEGALGRVDTPIVENKTIDQHATLSK